MFKIFLNYTFWGTINEVNNRAKFYIILRIIVVREFSMLASPLQ